MLPSADPARLAALLDASYPVIKKANPNAQVATGGLAPAATIGTTSIAPVTYISALLGDTRSFDAVAWHPYSYPALPSTPYAWSGFTQLGTAPQMPGVPTL